MPTVHGKIAEQNIDIVFGDITKMRCDAYVVPQFRRAVSDNGVGGAIMRAGASGGMAAYQAQLDKKDHGEVPFGTALITTAGGGNSKYLLHVASVGSDIDEEFPTVQKSIYNALVQAKTRGIKNIAAPALGTGIIGRLTPVQSARAMMSAIHQFNKQAGTFDKISLVVYGDKPAYQQFIDTLNDKSYENAVPEVGQKKFSFSDWIQQMKKDSSANEHFVKGN